MKAGYFVLAFLCLSLPTTHAESPKEIDMSTPMPVNFKQIMGVRIRNVGTDAVPMLVMDIDGPVHFKWNLGDKFQRLQTLPMKASDPIFSRCLAEAQKIQGGLLPDSRMATQAAAENALQITFQGNGVLHRENSLMFYMEYALKGCDVQRAVR